MASFFPNRASVPVESKRPVLHLSGPHIKNHFELLLAGSEPLGGIERYVEALELRRKVFQETLLNNDPATINYMTLRDLCSLMPTVRRRIGTYLEQPGLSQLRDGLVELLEGVEDTTTTDLRIKAFCERFPQDKKHRWVRDLAAEILHGTDPERYGLEFEVLPPLEYDEAIVDSITDLRVLADAAGTSIDVIQDLNPHLRSATPNIDEYIVYVPVE